MYSVVACILIHYVHAHHTIIQTLAILQSSSAQQREQLWRVIEINKNIYNYRYVINNNNIVFRSATKRRTKWKITFRLIYVVWCDDVHKNLPGVRLPRGFAPNIAKLTFALRPSMIGFGSLQARSALARSPIITCVRNQKERKSQTW